MLLTANDCNGAYKMDHDLWHMHCPDVVAQNWSDASDHLG